MELLAGGDNPRQDRHRGKHDEDAENQSFQRLTMAIGGEAILWARLKMKVLVWLAWRTD